jgi:hypothetical protein
LEKNNRLADISRQENLRGKETKMSNMRLKQALSLRLHL